MAATNYFGLYNFVSNSNGTFQGELARFSTNLENLYFSMNLTNFVPKSHCREAEFSFYLVTVVP